MRAVRHRSLYCSLDRNVRVGATGKGLRVLRKIEVCCLVFLLTGFAAARLDDPVAILRSSVPDLSARLVRLEERTSSRTDGRLVAADVAELLPELVEFDELGRPRSIQYRMLSRVLLDELSRLRARVAELETAGSTPDPRERVEPLVRITVARHE